MAAPSTSAAGAGGPRPAPPHYVQSESVKEKKDLASWWKNFKRSDKKGHEQVAPQGIFGVPLQASIRYANVAISLFNDEGQSYIYGYVPIVVAKCGVFLKEKATDVEGIFRLAGSEKRIKELLVAFDSPDRYGKGLDWTGYTVHDAANILRRYFNKLPEPIIPLEFYQKFREPLRNHQAQAVGAIETQSPSEGEFDSEGAIRAYQGLITELPPLNRQLLLYILDLLAVFASKSDLNKMTTPNLAAIFQPGILNHPQHDMAPQEYRLSQDVLIFLIENQDSFLIGMQGTAADPETVREVQSGSPAKAPSTPTTPNRSKTVIGRSGSNSSVAAESVRKWGSIRRNVSVSSKHSKRSENVAPGSPISTPPLPTGSGVHRSNTVPSRRGGSATQSPRFPREKHSDPSSPSSGSPNMFPGAVIARVDKPATSERPAVGLAVISPTLEHPSTADRQGSLQNTPIASQAPQAFPSTTTTLPATAQPMEVTSASSSEATTPLATVGSGNSVATVTDHQTNRKDTTPLLAPARVSSDRSTDRSASNTPSTSTASGRKFLDILKSPTSDGEGRKPNKLQKKRIPGSSLSSAHSSAQSLDERHGDFSPQSSISPTHATIAEVQNDSAYDVTPNQPSHSAQIPTTPQRYPTEATLRPTVSPSNSFHSHTDTSDADMVGDDMPQDSDQPEKKKRNRWRFSRTQNKLEQPSTPGNPLGTMTAREQAMSRSTIGSGGSQPRQSFQEPTPLASVATDPAGGLSPEPRGVPSVATSDMVFSDSERERKGPMSWLRNKIQERKEKDAEKRSQTPERSQHARSKSKTDLNAPEYAMPDRRTSVEHPWNSFEAKDVGGPAQTQPLPSADNAQTVKSNGDGNDENPQFIPEQQRAEGVSEPKTEVKAAEGGTSSQ